MPDLQKRQSAPKGYSFVHMMLLLSARNTVPYLQLPEAQLFIKPRQGRGILHKQLCCLAKLAQRQKHLQAHTNISRKRVKLESVMQSVHGC